MKISSKDAASEIRSDIQIRLHNHHDFHPITRIQMFQLLFSATPAKATALRFRFLLFTNKVKLNLTNVNIAIMFPSIHQVIRNRPLLYYTHPLTQSSHPIITNQTNYQPKEAFSFTLAILLGPAFLHPSASFLHRSILFNIYNSLFLS